MKLFKCYLLGLSLLSVMFLSCGDDEMITTINPDPMTEEQTYDNGVLIVNEGPFSGGSASLDFHDIGKDTLLRNVYSTVNDGQVIGSILQSVTVIGDNAYLVVNNSAKIEVVDAITMDYKNTITGVFGPRYIVALNNNEAVVSEWGLDGLSGQLKKINLSTMTVTDSVSVSGPEQMVISDDKIFVANSGGFGESNVVSVHGFDLVLEIEIPVGKRTIDMVQDINNDIWVLSGGSYTDGDGASLCQIKNNISENCMTLVGFPSDLIIDANGANLYYVENGEIKTVNVNSPTISGVVLVPNITGTIYGLGYDGNHGALYIGTTPDFSSESTTHVVFENGDANISFTTGVLTNGYVSR